MGAKREFQHMLLEIISKSSAKEMGILAQIIKRTKISFGHDQITLTWRSRCSVVRLGQQDFGVPDYIASQKNNYPENKQGLRLKEFSRETELLLNLLRLVPGSTKEDMEFWGQTLANQLLKIQGMIEDSIVK